MVAWSAFYSVVKFNIITQSISMKSDSGYCHIRRVSFFCTFSHGSMLFNTCTKSTLTAIITPSYVLTQKHRAGNACKNTREWVSEWNDTKFFNTLVCKIIHDLKIGTHNLGAKIFTLFAHHILIMFDRKTKEFAILITLIHFNKLV